MEYAFFTAPKQGQIHAGIVQNALAQVTGKVAAVTLVTHTDPWVVFVRCTEDLTEEERAAVATAIHDV